MLGVFISRVLAAPICCIKITAAARKKYSRGDDLADGDNA